MKSVGLVTIGLFTQKGCSKMLLVDRVKVIEMIQRYITQTHFQKRTNLDYTRLFHRSFAPHNDSV